MRKEDEERVKSPSLFIFSYESWIRTTSIKISGSRYFEWFMLFIIILSSVQLAVDNPLDDAFMPINSLFLHLDYVLSAIFAIEVIIKVIGFGLIYCGSKAYMKNYWNVLDLFIVIITISSYFTTTTNLSAIKVFKLIKVLRPLRAISKNAGLRISI